jgi:hypothetical protein
MHENMYEMNETEGKKKICMTRLSGRATFFRRRRLVERHIVGRHITVEPLTYLLNEVGTAPAEKMLFFKFFLALPTKKNRT